MLGFLHTLRRLGVAVRLGRLFQGFEAQSWFEFALRFRKAVQYLPQLFQRREVSPVDQLAFAVRFPPPPRCPAGRSSTGTPGGAHCTVAGWYAADVAAIDDARGYFAAEGYAVASIHAEERALRAAAPLAPAHVGKVLIVRFTIPATPA